MSIEEVLEQYKNVIHYEISKILNEYIDLWDDAIQETFIRINNSLPSILQKEGKHQENYIRVIARNAARTLRAKQYSETERMLSFEAWNETSGAEILDNPPETQIETAMEICLNKLKPEERDLLFLKDAENLGYEEISKALGISNFSCRKKVSRARKKLLQILLESTEGKNVMRGRVKYEEESI